MARKQKRRTSTNRPRPRPGLPQPQPQQSAPAPPPSTTATMSMEASTAGARPAPPRVGGDQALVRAVEMSLAPPTATTARRGGRGIVLADTGDASIPLDRVPYFTTDLVRVAITGAVMVALLVIAAVTIIPQVVK